ncbi:MAG: Gfo/Idh/MocA family protein [Phycisphaeraceae bacterium]
MQDMDEALPVAVVGVGRMGRHHARTYHKMAMTDLVAVVDFDQQRAQALADEYGCKAYASVEALLEHCPQVKAVTIAVPTQYHQAAATPLMQKGIACLMEKPIAGSAKEAAQIVELAKANGCVLQIGHTERFNPAVRALVAMDMTPRYIEVTRLSPMTFRSLDVGVVMDMMIHDLDIVLSLVGRPIVDVQAVGVTMLGEHEDLCDARLTFEGGCVVTMKGSRMALDTQRTLRLFSEDGYVSLDYGTREGIIVSKAKNAAALSDAKQRLSKGADLSDVNYLELIEAEPLSIELPEDETDQLTAQAKAFVHAIRTGSEPIVTGAHGSAAVDTAERIVAAITGHAWDELDNTSN